MDGVRAISRNELIAIMGALVGGWPETGMSEYLTVRLTGRIDRLERREMADGTQQVRLIDYKTGVSPTGEGLFNDLQLVCYQLGLVFPEESGMRGAQAVANAPNITQARYSMWPSTHTLRRMATPPPNLICSRRCSPMEVSIPANSYRAITSKNSTRISTTDSMTCFLRWK